MCGTYRQKWDKYVFLVDLDDKNWLQITRAFIDWDYDQLNIWAWWNCGFSRHEFKITFNKSFITVKCRFYEPPILWTFRFYEQFCETTYI